MKIEQKMLLQSWRTELDALVQSHYAKSVLARRLNYLLGIPIILISMVIMGYVAFSINHDLSYWMKMLAGSLLLVCAILSALQTFLKYAERSELHRSASSRYESLYWSVEQLLTFVPQEESDMAEKCEQLRKRWDELNLEVPQVGKIKRQRVSQGRGQLAAHEEEEQTEVLGEEEENIDVLENFDIDVLGPYDLNSRDR